MLKGLGSRFLVILGCGDVWSLVRCRVVGVSRLGFRAWGVVVWSSAGFLNFFLPKIPKP